MDDEDFEIFSWKTISSMCQLIELNNYFRTLELGIYICNLIAVNLLSISGHSNVYDIQDLLWSSMKMTQ